MPYEIEVVHSLSQPALVRGGDVAHDGIPAFLGEAFGAVMGQLAAQGVHPAGAPFARYALIPAGFVIEAGFPCSPGVTSADPQVRVVELPGGELATCLHVGAFGQIAGAYQALEQWMRDEGREPAGQPWEEYLDGPEVALPRTVVRWPIKPR